MCPLAHDSNERFYEASLELSERKRIMAVTQNVGLRGGYPDDPNEQVALAEEFSSALMLASPTLRKAARDLREGYTDGFCIKGMPEEPNAARIALLALTTRFGSAFNYAEQNSGKAVMDLIPSDKPVENTNACRGDFLIHSDDGFIPVGYRVEILSLLGLKNPVGTKTSYAPYLEARQQLSDQTEADLRDDRYVVRAPVSLGFGEDMWTGPIPVLKGPLCDFEIRYPSYAIRPADKDDEVAVNALRALYDAFEMNMHDVELSPGTLLSFSNLRGVHKRGPIIAGDRHVLRTYAIKNAEALQAATGVAGPIYPIAGFAETLRG